MDGHGEMGLIGEKFDTGMMARMRDDEYESRSGSDNIEGASGDDLDAGDDQRPKKKKYHRHTPHQIQELEAYDFSSVCIAIRVLSSLWLDVLMVVSFLYFGFSFFKECPHPDEKQRLDLSRRLGLETKQVKFWFQNRRTQMKVY